MKLTWAALKQLLRGERTSPPEGTLKPDTVKQMARGIMTTRDDEIDCTECFEQVDQFVEMKLAGRNAAEAMPLVQDHLDRCGNCREEFEALLAALRAMN
jgi:hypothetical protein